MFDLAPFLAPFFTPFFAPFFTPFFALVRAGERRCRHCDHERGNPELVVPHARSVTRYIVKMDERVDNDTASADTQVPTERIDRESEPLQLSGYEIGEVIGRGGMGEVVAAHDRRIEREVAMKRMRGEPSQDATERFLREAKIQARLDHPAIVPVHELGRDDQGRPYFTMKRLAGKTMLARLAAGGPAQPLLRAFVDVCFAIELAHQRGIVHRDLKPANIMLGDYNEVYVLDWGVARVLRAERTSAISIDSDVRPGMTAAGAMLGTPGYMAPEQMRGDEVGTAADVYSLGAILFEILAGAPLHPPGHKAIASTLGQPTVAPSERSPQPVPPELDALCKQALAEEPAQRPSARELAERVQRYLDGDRDAEMRRGLAKAQLDAVEAALAGGDQALAARHAARALAFDPTSQEAADLVARFLLAAPAQDPPELVRSFEAADAELAKNRSRRSVFAFLSVYLWAPFVFALDVTSWTMMIALFASCTAMAGIVYWNARTGRVPAPLLLAGNFVVAILFSRLASPFVIMPSIVCGMLLALSTHHLLETRRWLLAGWAAVVMVTPIVLEVTGVFAKTWRLEHDGLLTFSAMVSTHSTLDLASLIVGQTVLGVVVALYATAFARTTRDAQRRAHRQAWHLEQMLPSKIR
jgi:serine/threonine-protein kinase